VSTAIISLGSNLGDRKEMLKTGLERISFANKILMISDVYETYAANQMTKHPYLNCVIEIETDMSSGQLMQFLAETQQPMNASNTDESAVHQSIDLDLVAFDHEVLRTPQLTLPHPDAYRRAFVMVPLAQMKPDWVHPILNKNATEIAKDAYWDGWGTFYMRGKSLLDF
jgi:2-amino-4-hydroxy-6-hydroxymethyldihydropteridine diphosphokinase